MTEGLLPCRCSKKGEKTVFLNVYEKVNSNAPKEYDISCNKCWIKTFRHTDRARIIESWNTHTRTPDPALQEALEALRCFMRYHEGSSVPLIDQKNYDDAVDKARAVIAKLEAAIEEGKTE